MPVIGLSLAIVPIVAILAARALLKLLFLPVRGAYVLARSRPGRTISVLALCTLGVLVWSQMSRTDRAAASGTILAASLR